MTTPEPLLTVDLGFFDEPLAFLALVFLTLDLCDDCLLPASAFGLGLDSRFFGEVLFLFFPAPLPLPTAALPSSLS
jgi:hypothetical protein